MPFLVLGVSHKEIEAAPQVFSEFLLPLREDVFLEVGTGSIVIFSSRVDHCILDSTKASTESVPEAVGPREFIARSCR